MYLVKQAFLYIFISTFISILLTTIEDAFLLTVQVTEEGNSCI